MKKQKESAQAANKRRTEIRRAQKLLAWQMGLAPTFQELCEANATCMPVAMVKEVQAEPAEESSSHVESSSA